MVEKLYEAPQDSHSTDLKLEADVFWAIFNLSQEINDLQEKWGSSIGLNAAEWTMIRALRDLGNGADGVSGIDLAINIRVSPSFVSLQAKSLEAHGWIRRFRSSQDKRINLLSLTPFAANELSILRSTETQLIKSILSSLNTTELNSFLDICAKLQAKAAKAILLSQIVAD